MFKSISVERTEVLGGSEYVRVNGGGPYYYKERFTVAEPVSDGLTTLLADRAKTHGDFAENAAAAQVLKHVFKTHGKHTLTDVQAEGLDLIALKLSRILTGAPNNPDNWDDLAGYAKRVADDVRQNSKD